MTSCPEFSRLVFLAEKPTPEFRLSLDADENECRALAERFSVNVLQDFHIDATVTWTPGGRVTVRARIKARVGQSCVISLAPVETAIDEDVEFCLEPATDRDGPPAPEESLDLLQKDPEESLDLLQKDQEILTDDCFDLGEHCVQYLGLAIDAYPRAAGVTIEDLATAGHPVQSEEEAAKVSHPFAALAELQDKT